MSNGEKLYSGKCRLHGFGNCEISDEPRPDRRGMSKTRRRAGNKEIEKELFNVLVAKSEQGDQCLHDSCAECNGTGRKSNGSPCVHMLSCPCKKCSPFTY